ncbi:MAG: hypothetical protein HZA54_12620 [Planctomycetes bacterium]|nr:hypothetical protein [Planctomycetota bacterium]
MELFPTQVRCYAGYQADESPRSFLWKGAWVEVQAVVDRWYQRDQHPEQPMADYFKVLGPDGHRYLLKHDRESDAWLLALPQEGSGVA